MWIFGGGSILWVSVVSEVGCGAGGCGCRLQERGGNVVVLVSVFGSPMVVPMGFVGR